MIPRLDPLEYTYAEFHAKHKQRAHMKRNTARVWLGGIAGGVVWTAWGFFVGLRQAPHLRGDAETRIVPEGTALSAFHADLDCLDIRDVDSDRASLRVGSRHRRPWTEDGSQNRNDRWILRWRTGQLRASSLVADPDHVAARMDARPVDRLDPSRASRRLFVQRISSRRDAACRVSFASPQDRTIPVSTVLLRRFHHHRRPIRQNFRDALHHFGCIVASADDSVAPDFRGVLQHQIECFSARSLT